ncbi:hypothetical protein ACFC08_35815 [Streptomyces sp. NPDC056112]|uniref:hypothetical protein n=1 Tax=Streptomyces sp. NPDC056112 TaxID=3345715 RepID=UPI0035E2721E
MSQSYKVAGSCSPCPRCCGGQAFGASSRQRNQPSEALSAGPPLYKSNKDVRQSIRLNINVFSLWGNGTVSVAKVGSLNVKWSHRLPLAPTSLTVTTCGACGRAQP